LNAWATRETCKGISLLRNRNDNYHILYENTENITFKVKHIDKKGDDGVLSNQKQERRSNIRSQGTNP